MLDPNGEGYCYSSFEQLVVDLNSRSESVLPMDYVLNYAKEKLEEVGQGPNNTSLNFLKHLSFQMLKQLP
jgi:hypothetical protein